MNQVAVWIQRLVQGMITKSSIKSSFIKMKSEKRQKLTRKRKKRNVLHNPKIANLNLNTCGLLQELVGVFPEAMLRMSPI